jgi:hypothetical protein
LIDLDLTGFAAADDAYSSKRAHRWSMGRAAGVFYDQATIIVMKAKDVELTAKILRWILDMVKGR